MPENLHTTTANRLLSRLSRADFRLLQPHLAATDLPVRRQLEARKKRIDNVYFIEHGFASVVANGTGRSVEVGLIGREGMTGLAVVMGTDRSPNETFIQAAGDGQRLSAANLRNAIARSATLQRLLLNYAHAFMIQTTHTALANGRSKIEERLSRWLLMAHDRLDRDELPLTHEFLAIMLGVHRPGVTLAVQILERAGLIDARRGKIILIDRKGLEKSSNGAYGGPEAEFRRLLG